MKSSAKESLGKNPMGNNPTNQTTIIGKFPIGLSPTSFLYTISFEPNMPYPNHTHALPLRKVVNFGSTRRVLAITLAATC